jgi:hypothetical protein
MKTFEFRYTQECPITKKDQSQQNEKMLPSQQNFDFWRILKTNKDVNCKKNNYQVHIQERLSQWEDC